LISILLTEDFRGVSQTHQANFGIVLRTVQDQLLPDLFQFTIHVSSYYPMIYSLHTESVVKQPAKENIEYTASYPRSQLSDLIGREGIA
jgi:hypothetical protein